MATDHGPGDSAAESWEALFGFSEPYENQADAIKTAIEIGRENGYLVMEGPCGTGKTMAALTAAGYLLRETDLYDNVVVITPVKQQLQQFVDDLRSMNTGMATPLTGIALVGKADLCPYGREGVFPEDVGVHGRCQDLREHTADLVEFDGDGAGPSASIGSAAVRPQQTSDEIWWDSERASELTRAARRTTGTAGPSVDEPLVTAGVESPYGRRQPTAPEDFVDAGDPPPYCPFEADWYARNKGSPVGFDRGNQGVITSDEFLPASVERGTCPHRVMGVLLEHADVVIGNYNHLFDAKTREFTNAILDDRTFVIVDEAHRLEGRVRDLLSDRIGRQTLRQARGDLDRLLEYAQQNRTNRERVETRLATSEVSLEAVERTFEFYADVEAWLNERIEAHLADEFEGYGTMVGPAELPEDGLEIPLRDPSTVEPDELTEWAEENGHGGAFCRQLGAIGAAVEKAFDEIDPGRTCVCTAVGVLMGYWWERDHTTYLREITLDYSPRDIDDPSYPWEQWYTPALVMYNCLPAEALSDVFDGLGGGILMSATLEPLDVFEEVVGLDRLANPDDTEGSRPVVERTYDLPFPEEHRASWIVDAPPFTARNRGEPTLENRNETREEYTYVLQTLAESPGNVLLAMPNYREATWAGERLREAIDKPVLIDESSSKEATDALKREFFAGDGKVLVTSTRGTLTEGVDYDGDKLHTCAVVGIPLVNIGSPRVQAVTHAYGDAYGTEHAFEYALTVPAVRRARQAIGRVIRGPEECGVRVLVDHRYTNEARRHSVYGYLSADERTEFVRMTPMFLGSQLDQFWSSQNPS